MKKTLRFLLSLLTLVAAGTLAAEAATQPSSLKPYAQGNMTNRSKFSTKEAHFTESIGTEAPQKSEPISGTVLQTVNNGGFSYIYLQQKSGAKIWVAVEEMPITAGKIMSFKPGIVMTNFESKGLQRTFDAVVFSDGPVATPDLLKKQEASADRKGMAAAKDGKVSVVKAAGHNAITVAEAYIYSRKLDKKKVVVNGEVVKVSPRIMKRNWIHIQDGTGSQKKGTNSLVCTSKDMAKVGDLVTIRGTLAKDRDFGSGYRYKAIIENATVTKLP